MLHNTDYFAQFVQITLFFWHQRRQLLANLQELVALTLETLARGTSCEIAGPGEEI
jgi:hypothetical protein